MDTSMMNLTYIYSVMEKFKFPNDFRSYAVRSTLLLVGSAMKYMKVQTKCVFMTLYNKYNRDPEGYWGSTLEPAPWGEAPMRLSSSGQCPSLLT